MARLAAFGAISAVLAGGVIASAFAQRSNFYAACIYLYRSNACMMIILNLGLFLTIIMGQLVQAIFFGNLRTLEVEHLYERAWYAVTETCLAMTIFKDEFDTRFIVMFTMLLFLKVFHWLCMDRVDSMEQSPEIPLSFHIRMVTIMMLLVSLDVLLVFHAVSVFNFRGPNMMIMFGFEYTLLATSLTASFGKYVLHTIDMRSEEPWENKSMLLFYLDLVADFVKLVTYLLFFTVILVFYGLPLHIIRDVYMTMRSFLQKCKDLIQYRKATRNMNERYPDATPAELSALSDPICIICREEMVGSQQAHPPPGTGADGTHQARPATPRPTGSSTNVPKKLPCGHIFHFQCLKSWLERQQSCPTCRRLVLDPPTPASTPAPQAGGDAAPAPGAAAAAAGAGQPAGGAVPGFGHFGNNNAQPAPGLHHRMGGYPLFAPQGHYPLAGWHPQAMQGGAFPGGVPQAGAQATGTGAGVGTATTTATAPAGTGASMGEAGGMPGVVPGPQSPLAQANYIPHYSIPDMMHPIPGLIPLFPVAGAGRQDGLQQPALGSAANPQQLGFGAHASATSPFTASTFGGAGRFTSDQIPLSSLDLVTDEQLVYLEQNTRRGLQERLRVLQAVQEQIAHSVLALEQVLTVLPPEGTPIRSDTADPPSPNMPFTAGGGAGSGPRAGTPSSSSGMNWMYNGSFGAASTPSTSHVGLQSMSGGGLGGAFSNGASGSETAGTISSDSSATGASNLASSFSVQESTSSVAEPFTSVLPSSTQAAPMAFPEATAPAYEERAGRSSSELKRASQEIVDKGKRRKTEAELELESAAAPTSVAAHVDVDGDEEMDEDEDSKYSPQEMVRRRWARVNSSRSD
ncbi:E3 ubiquitin-protein ligase hrd1 [Dissophora globulifera]|nr:E3 ubiquitin-protein ligase hrd1 [Dissophora globulifera]